MNTVKPSWLMSILFCWTLKHSIGNLHLLSFFFSCKLNHYGILLEHLQCRKSLIPYPKRPRCVPETKDGSGVDESHRSSSGFLVSDGLSRSKGVGGEGGGFSHVWESVAGVRVQRVQCETGEPQTESKEDNWSTNVRWMMIIWRQMLPTMLF